jgi:hypothetical protein
MTQYSYGIVKENYPTLRNLSTYLDNKYDAKKKYALIEKQCFKDGSEGINRIIYSNDLENLSKQLEGYPTWYNYPKEKRKNIQGYISDLL